MAGAHAEPAASPGPERLGLLDLHQTEQAAVEGAGRVLRSIGAGELNVVEAEDHALLVTPTLPWQNGAVRTIRPATLDDLDLLVRVDLEDEGVTPGYRDGWAEADFAEHGRQIEAFVTDGDKGALVAEEDGRRAGTILWRARNVRTEDLPDWSVFRMIGLDAFPSDGAVLEIFLLWTHPDFRRRGIATELKLAAEDAARAQGVGAVYAHTEERNEHVLELNRRLGYREVRRGPIWDDVVRVSLVKRL